MLEIKMAYSEKYGTCVMESNGKEFIGVDGGHPSGYSVPKNVTNNGDIVSSWVSFVNPSGDVAYEYSDLFETAKDAESAICRHRYCDNDHRNEYGEHSESVEDYDPFYCLGRHTDELGNVRHN